jgi:hypothetical protein
MLPAAVVAWFIDDDDVAETRGLRPPAPPPDRNLEQMSR